MRKDASSAPSRKRDRSNIGAAFCTAQPKPRPPGRRAYVLEFALNGRPGASFR
jgi:hypothetical protein